MEPTHILIALFALVLLLQTRRAIAERRSPAGEADTDDARVGFTVSRKVGNAVLRNRARRRLKAVADKVMTEHAQGQVDFVIIGRKNTLTRPFSALMGDLTTALKKLDAYR